MKFINVLNKNEMISRINELDFITCKKLVFNTYTHEIFSIASVIPIIQYGLNSKMNAFVYILFSLLIAIFFISYYKKIQYLIKIKLINNLYLTFELFLILLFFIGVFIYAHFCIENVLDNVKNKVFTTYDYVFILPIIVVFYILGITIYNQKYYLKPSSIHFKKLYKSKNDN